MSKSALKALANADAMIKAAGILNAAPLVEYLNDGKGRTVNGKKLWRNADVLASLLICAAADCLQTETPETLEENHFKDMAEAVDRYVASALDAWSQVEWMDCKKGETAPELDRLAEMVNGHIEYMRRRELTAPIEKQIGVNNREIAETTLDGRRTTLAIINSGLREMVKRLKGETPDYRIMPGEEVQHADHASVCNACACLIANDDHSAFEGREGYEDAKIGIASWCNEWNTLSIDHDKTAQDVSFSCDCCGARMHGEKFHLVLANFRN